MNIMINTQLMLKEKLDGIGWFTYETVNRITHQHPEHHFYLIFDRSNHGFSFPDNVTPLVLKPQSRHPLLWLLRFEILLPFLVKKYKADIFVSPDGWMSLGLRIPTLYVLHDINFIHYPKDFAFTVRKYFTLLFPRYSRKATRVVTVSHYSKQDIIKNCHIASEKIDVVYNGCNTMYQPMSEDINTDTRQRFSSGKPYFIYVGALIPRKNIARLFLAFDAFKKRTSSDMKLLVVGHKKKLNPQTSQALKDMQFKQDVVFLGRQSVENLRYLYAGAHALTFVPYFEGFGIPILEAFNAGTAVITSNITSMPEVAGDAALLCDPFSVNSISNAMVTITNDHALRQALIQKGKERAKLFSWDVTAENLWKSIEKVMRSKTEDGRSKIKD
jgi:glycosyltransferase involved in cell wall biosynthesis